MAFVFSAVRPKKLIRYPPARRAHWSIVGKPGACRLRPMTESLKTPACY